MMAQKRGYLRCLYIVGMLDLMMWPWLERLPLLEYRGITLPEFQTLKVYIGNMWQTGNGIFPHFDTGSTTIPLHNLIHQRRSLLG